MDRFKAMQVFVEVARAESFAAAARTLGLSTTATSRMVRELEDWLGLRLLTRTTRRVSLTDAGRAHLEPCARLVGEVDELERSAKAQHIEPRGEIRLTAPVFMGKVFLSGVLPAFLTRHPQVSVRLHLIDRFVNLVEEGIDLALRVGELSDSSLIARRIGDVRLITAAAPAYLAERGTPQAVEDLKRHDCIVDTVSSHGDRWPLGTASGRTGVRVDGVLSVNSGEFARDAAVAGVGIALLPDFIVARDLAAGRLRAVLPDTCKVEAGIFLVHPQARHQNSAVRALIDFLVARKGRLSAAIRE
jgi:DNA-binding transcriptional LysR family regulator